MPSFAMKTAQASAQRYHCFFAGDMKKMFTCFRIVRDGLTSPRALSMTHWSRRRILSLSATQGSDTYNAKE